jgi:5-methylcytosine-specific restriction protein A
MMATLSEIEPTKNLLLIDLLRTVGVDVSDWANCKRGPSYAASNPKYCYEWSFVEPGRFVVLTIWYVNLRAEVDRTIYTATNMRHVAERPGVPSSFCRRAHRYDEAIQTACRERLPIRAIICDGKMRGVSLPSSEASRTKKRLLDPVEWSVESYDDKTGDCVLRRGIAVQTFVDQFSISPAASPDPERRATSGFAFVRSAEVRRRVVFRAGGKCEWCGQPGFTTADGRIYLETHHVIPLAEKGVDTERNVVSLCPNHHREAHFGRLRDEMRRTLLEAVGTG